MKKKYLDIHPKFKVSVISECTIALFAFMYFVLLNYDLCLDVAISKRAEPFFPFLFIFFQLSTKPFTSS